VIFLAEGNAVVCCNKAYRNTLFHFSCHPLFTYHSHVRLDGGLMASWDTHLLKPQTRDRLFAWVEGVD
jgi:hypothetical protein